MIRKTWAMAKKELLHIVRAPGTLIMVVASPLVMLGLMGYALAVDIKSVPVAVLDKDMTPLSLAYVRQITAGPDLVVTRYADSLAEVDYLLEHNEIRAAIIIQSGFERDVQSLTSFPVQVIVDGTEPSSGGFAFRHIAAHTSNFIQQRIASAALMSGGMIPTMEDPLDLRLRVWYNPDLSATQDVIPALIAVILSLPAVSMSAAIAREKEHGSLEQLIASPLKKVELLTGKIIPYVITGVADVFLSLAAAHVWFGTRFRGSLLLLLFFSICYFIANLAVGLVISIYSRTQQTAMMMAILFFLFPGFFLSGIFFPLISMPPAARLEANMLPVTQFVTILRGLFLKGVGFDVLWGNALTLLIMGVVIGTFGVLRFQKKLA